MWKITKQLDSSSIIHVIFPLTSRKHGIQFIIAWMYYFFLMWSNIRCAVFQHPSSMFVIVFPHLDCMGLLSREQNCEHSSLGLNNWDTSPLSEWHYFLPCVKTPERIVRNLTWCGYSYSVRLYTTLTYWFAILCRHILGLTLNLVLHYHGIYVYWRHVQIWKMNFTSILFFKFKS